jgi:hypothetical protein
LNDKLSEALDIPTNGTEFSFARRDKEAMAAAVAPYLAEISTGEWKAETIPGASFSNSDAALKWIRDQKIPYPVLVKPSGSAATFGLAVCKNEEEVIKAFKKNIGFPDPLGLKIERCMVQLYVHFEGTIEWVNDTVGPHLTNLFEYEKEHRDGNILYKKTKLTRFENNNSLHLFFKQFARAVSKGLRVRYGPLHIEGLVVASRKTVYFVEAGARPAGAKLPLLARSAGVLDHMTLTLLQAFDPERFESLIAQGPTYDQEAISIELISTKEGYITSLSTFAEMRARIPGFLYADMHFKKGDWLAKTTNLIDQPGVILVRGSRATIEAAVQEVRKWEAENFYRVSKYKFPILERLSARFPFLESLRATSSPRRPLTQPSLSPP